MNDYPILTQECLDLLRQEAEQLYLSDMYPVGLKRYFNRVIEDGGQPRIVKSFNGEGTKAAILTMMISIVEEGGKPMTVLLDLAQSDNPEKRDPTKAPKPDPFTEKELAERGAPKSPDFKDLKQPTTEVSVTDVLKKKEDPRQLPSKDATLVEPGKDSFVITSKPTGTDQALKEAQDPEAVLDAQLKPKPKKPSGTRIPGKSKVGDAD